MGKVTDSSQGDAMRPSRVVVLIDASPDALKALELAAELARQNDVPLLAVSVEEPDRARSAAFSFAREVGAVSGSIRPVDAALLRRRHERGPAGIRRTVERVSRRANATWELMVLRGRLVDEVLALSEPGDYLMLGRVGWSARLGRKLGRAPLMLARQAMGTVHICSAAPARERGRVAALVEDAASARTVLAVAAAQARAMKRDLVVLLAPAVRDTGGFDHRAGMIEAAGARCRSRELPALGTGDLLRILAEESAVELVVGRDGAWLESPAAARVLALWRMPVLITPVPDA